VSEKWLHGLFDGALWKSIVPTSGGSLLKPEKQYKPRSQTFKRRNISSQNHIDTLIRGQDFSYITQEELEAHVSAEKTNVTSAKSNRGSSVKQKGINSRNVRKKQRKDSQDASWASKQWPWAAGSVLLLVLAFLFFSMISLRTQMIQSCRFGNNSANQLFIASSRNQLVLQPRSRNGVSSH
jgi:hypothetical protein